MKNKFKEKRMIVGERSKLMIVHFQEAAYERY